MRLWRLGFAPLFWAAIALAAPLADAQTAPTPVIDPTPSGSDWAAIGKLPDWSGVWVPDRRDQGRQVKSNPPPWNAHAAAQVAHMEAEEAAGRPKGLLVNCLPHGLPSFMLITHNALEFAYQPGRVIMLGESDGNRLRRIFTDGRGHPADPDPTFFGNSIGHWEGDTLVIDTIAILPEAYLAVSESVGVANNGDMHVVERLHLTGPDTLADDLTITAPKVLTKPWTTTRLFSRTRERLAEISEGVCLQGKFMESVDANGDAAFTPVQYGADGSPLPPKF
jgi:hypothetical protein